MRPPEVRFCCFQFVVLFPGFGVVARRYGSNGFPACHLWEIALAFGVGSKLFRFSCHVLTGVKLEAGFDQCLRGWYQPINRSGSL